MTQDAMQEALKQAVANLTQDLRDRMQRGDTLAEAAERLTTSIGREFAVWPDVLSVRLTALANAKTAVEASLHSVRYLQKSAIRNGRPDWYAGPGDDAVAWARLKTRLGSIGRTDDEILGVDEESTTVLSLLDNPGQEQFSTRGLVIGHVQSGKTGNMAAVIAKAADTPFKFFIVLSGMTDSLRNQTQARLDADILGSDENSRWFSWTRVDRIDGGQVDKGDFNHPAVGGFQLAGTHKHLAVVKKNAGVLRRVLNKLRNTPVATLRQTPVLIIDDECDQASVNAAALDRAISTINKLLRDILELLPRVSYVGYTATPFANVLIDPRNSADLYPRHFIHPLRRPPAYFGAVELFGREAMEGDRVDIESGYDMIRIVPADEVGDLRPSGRASRDFSFAVTPELGNAIRYFAMTVAAREHRGQESEHCSMLVHTSVLNTVHRSAEAAIKPYLSSLGERLAGGDQLLTDELEDLWDDECDRVDASDFGHEKVDFAHIEPMLEGIIRSIEVKVENWSSTDRIDYSEPARRYLVIGGNVLARGLTLHGLVVSFFMRSSSQYDTLMQMGRWFGYRPGFEDLPRVWMEETVRDAFFDLATVEEEMRRDAIRYATEDFTPEQFAVRIRKIPGLAITARAKMRSAVTANIGYEGEHVQTIKFLRKDNAWLQANWDAAGALVSTGTPIGVRGNKIIRSVSVDEVRAFLGSYTVESNRTMERELLLGYLDHVESQDSSLERWNIAVICSVDGRGSAQELGALGTVKCVRRSPLRGSGQSASIKALMSKQDLLADMESMPPGIAKMGWDQLKAFREQHRMPPLLLLYPIDRDSAPADERTRLSREPMDAPMDVIGLGLAFPGDPDSGTEYVHADLQADDAAESYEGENALPEEVLDGAR